MSAEPGPDDHRAALAALRMLARRTASGQVPGVELDAAIDDAAADPAARDLARMYVFAARVGGAAAAPDRAAMWLRGWASSPARQPHELHAAVLDGIRFAERLHRALGLPPLPPDGGAEA